MRMKVFTFDTGMVFLNECLSIESQFVEIELRDVQKRRNVRELYATKGNINCGTLTALTLKGY